MYKRYCRDNGIKIEEKSPQEKVKLYQEFLNKMREDDRKEKYENLDFFNKKGMGENFTNFILMANYLIQKGHNSDTFNPFEYPIQKLIKTFRIVKMNDLEDKNEMMYSQMIAIGTCFGNSDMAQYFIDQRNKYKGLL